MTRCSAMLASVLSALAVFACGCERQGEVQRPSPASISPQAAPRASRVLVPEFVAGRWHAVKIAVQDKVSGLESVYTVEIGKAFKVADTDLRVEVLTFLPAFVMEEITLTSVSNETRNPAVQLRITEGGRVVFEGWMFSLFPEAHPFHDPRFKFTLVDFIPSE